jgi:uncharacterized small protein (DUF1192 family)
VFNSQNFYANSAPSSSVGFNTPQSTRPPVPLFNSAPNLHQQQQQQQQLAQRQQIQQTHQHQRVHSTGNMASGMPHAVMTHDNMPLTRKLDFELFTDLSSGLGSAADFNLNSNDLALFGEGSTFTSINHPPVGSTSTRTVSPKDLFNDGGLSAPPSTAFTNLTSPDINSPLGIDSYETSPMFGADDLNSAGPDNWYSLFPEGNSSDANTSFNSAQPLERTVSTQSLAQSSASSNNSPLVLDVHNRRKSSNSVASPQSGVKKQRRRQHPLPPITVDPQDKVAMKRARNTLAARESRARKLTHVTLLEERVAELEAEVERWKSLAAAHGADTSLQS